MTAIQINKIPNYRVERIPTAIDGLDNLLGDGFVPGQAVLFAGEPGVGKSTFLLQVANSLAERGEKVLYISGEENMGQVKIRANRLGTLHPEIWVAESVELEKIMQRIIEIDPKIVIIDSLQMVYHSKKKGEPGSGSQMKHCLREMIHAIKESNKILIAVGHTTKSGLIAGLLTLQHNVDTLLYFYLEEDGIRRLYAKKNRFGPAQVSWYMVMTQDGLVDAETQKELHTKSMLSNFIAANEPSNTELVRIPKEEIDRVCGGLLGAATKDSIFYILDQSRGDNTSKRIVSYEIIFKLKNN